MSLTVILSDEVEGRIENLSEEMSLCTEDTIKRALGLGIQLYEEEAKGNRIVIKRRWPKQDSMLERGF